jgi:hypothetical protein
MGEIADAPDLLPESADGPDGSCAQKSFELCEGHLDRIETGTLGHKLIKGIPLTACF